MVDCRYKRNKKNKVCKKKKGKKKKSKTKIRKEVKHISKSYKKSQRQKNQQQHLTVHIHPKKRKPRKKQSQQFVYQGPIAQRPTATAMNLRGSYGMAQQLIYQSPIAQRPTESVSQYYQLETNRLQDQLNAQRNKYTELEDFYNQQYGNISQKIKEEEIDKFYERKIHVRKPKEKIRNRREKKPYQWSKNNPLSKEEQMEQMEKKREKWKN